MPGKPGNQVWHQFLHASAASLQLRAQGGLIRGWPKSGQKPARQRTELYRVCETPQHVWRDHDGYVKNDRRCDHPGRSRFADFFASGWPSGRAVGCGRTVRHGEGKVPHLMTGDAASRPTWCANSIVANATSNGDQPMPAAAFGASTGVGTGIACATSIVFWPWLADPEPRSKPATTLSRFSSVRPTTAA
jgi:hypothetical protein